MTVHVAAQALKKEIVVFETELKKQAKLKGALNEKFRQKKTERIEKYRKVLADIEAAIKKIEADGASPLPPKKAALPPKKAAQAAPLPASSERAPRVATRKPPSLWDSLLNC